MQRECNVCLVLRGRNRFTENEFNSEFPVCKKCMENDQGVKTDYKWRVCLKCEKKFLAKNNCHLCSSCKDINRNIYLEV